MAAFKRFSFGDFEIPPLDLPTFPAVPATNDTDHQAVTLRTDSLVDEDAEDGVHPETPQQESTSMKGSLEPVDQFKQSGNYVSQEAASGYNDGGMQATTELPMHPAHRTAFSGSSR